MYDFKFRFRIFIWFLLTEPIRQVKDLYGAIKQFFVTLNKTMTWIYIFIGLALYQIGKENQIGTMIIFIVLIIAILLWEWESGNFMYQHRKHNRKRINKKLEEEENDNME